MSFTGRMLGRLGGKERWGSSQAQNSLCKAKAEGKGGPKGRTLSARWQWQEGGRHRRENPQIQPLILEQGQCYRFRPGMQGGPGAPAREGLCVKAVSLEASLSVTCLDLPIFL